MGSRSHALVYGCAAALAALLLAGAVVGNDLTALEETRMPRPGQPDREQLEQPHGILDSVAPADSTEKEPDEPNGEEDEEKPEGLFGERFHGRGGISAEYIYTGDVLANTHGGIRTGTSYRGLFELVLQADLDKMELGPGGKLFLDGQQGHGRGFTERLVGDAMWVSNIDWRDMTQVAEYWYEKEFFDKKLALRVGKIDANAEFSVVDLGGDYVNSAFGMVPTVPMPTFPNPSAGAMLFVRLNEQLDLKVGVWDGCPNGETWGFSDTGITFTIGEVKLRWDLRETKGLPGDFHAGLWYHSGPWDDLRFLPQATSFGSAPRVDPLRNTRYLPLGALRPRRGSEGASGNGRTVDGNHGVYLGADQLLWREAADDEKDVQGLGVFVQYGWNPEQCNWGHQYYGGGVLYRGPLPSRDEDEIGVGVGHLVFSECLPATENETAVELFYMARVTKWMKLQPDLQYIVNPGGIYRDALVAGARFEVVF